MDRAVAVCLISGGMDSCVAAALSRDEFQLAFLHARYGQKTERRELEAFNAIADYYQCSQRLVVSLDHLGSIGGSSLTDRGIAVANADLNRTGVPSSYVPFRNANLLSIAVSWAEKLDARAVVVGAVEEDSSGYPDCRREFYDAFQVVIDHGTKPGSNIRISTPVIGMSKAQIVAEGIRLGVPFHLTWSCYKNADLACGECDSCALRLRGFEMAGVADPIPYVHRPRYVGTDAKDFTLKEG